jgi:hypothetical protein
MTLPPWLVLAFLLALLLATLYQLVTRRFGWRLLVYWVLVVSGLLGAEMVAESMGWDVTRWGDLRLGPDLGGAFLVIGFLWFLGL